MNTKLLKKLRRRFYWYRKSPFHCWIIFDKKQKKEIIAVMEGWNFINDQALEIMFNLLGLTYIPLNNRKWNKRNNHIKSKVL